MVRGGNGNDTVLAGGARRNRRRGDQDYGFQDQVICGAVIEDIVYADDNDEVDEATCETLIRFNPERTSGTLQARLLRALIHRSSSN